MKKFTLDNLEDLTMGAAILGSGGGGSDPSYAHLCYMLARHELLKHGPISLISYSDLDPDDLIAPIGFTGAHLVQIERMPSGREFLIALNLIEKSVGKKIKAVMPFQIGGANGLVPLIMAAQLGLPIVDADTMGRAFPTSLMISTQMLEATPATAFIVDCLGNTAIINAKNSYLLEKIGRQATIAMGSCGLYCLYPVSANQAPKCTIPKSISKAMALGTIHKDAKGKKEDPLNAVLKSCKGSLIGEGKIVDIDRSNCRGFIEGGVVIENKDYKIEIAFQNEYLIAKSADSILATTPDIIVILEKETGTPIACESLQYGLKVHLAVLPAPEIWTTPNGLAVTGPRAFGYKIDYQPINKNQKK